MKRTNNHIDCTKMNTKEKIEKEVGELGFKKNSKLFNIVLEHYLQGMAIADHKIRYSK